MRKPILAADPDELVAKLVRPREHVHLAGTPSRPNALTYALCRVLGESGHLTISTTAVHSSAHAIALSGVADQVVAGFAGDTYPSPRPNPLYADLANGRPFTFEAWTLMSYLERLMAGAQGLPWAVTSSLAGTDLAEDKHGDVVTVPDPRRPGQQVTLLSPMRPDVTMIHGVVADEDGNVVLAPPFGEGAWAAYAAERGVIASVERIVPARELREMPDRVVIPGQLVIGLCEAPFGAHPQSLRTSGLGGARSYLDDYAFIEEIAEACHGPEAGRDWYREWVSGAGSHDGYRKQLGRERLDALVEAHDADTARWRELSAGADGADAALEPAHGPDDRPTSRQERLIVLGARAIAAQVREHGYDTLLAGIGTSHMSAWLAAVLSRRAGIDVKIMAELGMYGFAPSGGDVYLFSLLHAGNSEMLVGIPEILGGMVAANPRALGVLAAAEIDEHGTINTSRSAQGGWLTGSGGANDIASTTDVVVIAPSSRRRYVREVSYRTSPGDRVREVISDLGRFRPKPGREGFRLVSWFPPDDVPPERLATGEIDVQAAARAAVEKGTSWDAEIGDPEGDLDVEAPVTADELRVLRLLDPDGRYR